MSDAQVELSAMVVTPDRDTIAVLLDSLAAQHRPERIEIVAVVPRDGSFAWDEQDRQVFGRCTTVEVDDIDDLKRTRVAGIAASHAEVLMLAETHCYPGPGWLDSVLAAHREGWSVVGPRFENANPATAISWANFVDHYARFWNPSASGELDEVCGHNATMRRDELLALGQELEPLLRDFPALHAALGRRGGVYLASDAAMRHVNMSTPRGWLVEAWAGGRVGAAARARRWTKLRRFAYALAWPLIAAVETARRVPHFRRLARAGELGQAVMPLVALGIIVRCMGEAVGFVTLAPGRSDAVIAHTEIHRLDYVTAADRRALGAVDGPEASDRRSSEAIAAAARDHE